MATTTTVKEYTGDGSDKTWAYTFQSYQKEDIKVSVTNASGTFVDVTNFTIPDYTTAGGTVTFNNTGVNSDVCESDGAPTNTRIIRIRRETDITTGSVGEYDPKTTHQVGSSIRAGDLNNNQKQALYAIYEAHDQEAITKDIRDKAITSAKLDTNIDIAGTFDVTGAAKFDSTVEVDGTIQLDGATTINAATVITDDLNIKADNKTFTVENASGTDKFTIDTDNGNTAIAGTLDVTGATGIDGNFDINTNKFNVTASNGNTTIAGTLGVTGQTTLTGALDANGGATIGNIQIGVTGDNEIDTASGNLTIDSAGGTVTVDDNLTVTGNLNAGSSNITASDIAATSLSGTVMVTASEENAGITANDTTVFSTSAADARFYQIGTSDDIQSTESWDSSDVKVATTKAVDARVITLVDEVGGFVPITNETDFPATNPDINSAAGTIVSIGVLTTSYTSSGSGVITIPASTLDNLSNDLTITGAENSTTYGANFGMLVETKALSDAAYAANPSYTFHRLVPKASEVTTLAGKATEMGRLGTLAAIEDLENLGTTDAVSDMDTLGTPANVTAMSTCSTSIANINTVAGNLSSVNDFAARYRVGSDTTDPTTSLDPGDLFFAYDSSTPTNSKLRVYNGSSWQDGVTATGNLIAKTGDTFTGDVKIDNGKEIRLIEPGGGANYTGFKAQAQSGDVTYSLPAAAAGTDKYLKTTGSDATVLEWGTVTSTPEGEAVKSTTNGNEAATKYLRADGSGGASWQSLPVDPNTTYTQAANDAGSGNVNLRLTDSGAGTDDILITAGSNVTISSISAAGFTIASTNTTYSVVDSSAAGLAPTLPGSHGGKFLRGDGTWVVPPDNNTQVAIDDTPVDGVTNEAISSNWAFDHAAATGNGAHVPAAGSSGQFLKHDGTWGTPPDTTTPADDSVTGAKLNISLVQGDVIYASGTDTLERLAKGSAGEVLTMNSGETAPEWGAASSGTITALNHQAANRLTTIGSTTTQLDGEASLTFEDTTSTGLISGKQITGRGFECPATVSDDWTIAAANNAMFPGPMTIASAKTVTVPAGRTLTIV